MARSLSRRPALAAALLLALLAGVLVLAAGGSTRAAAQTAPGADADYTPPFTGCAFRSSKAVRRGPVTGKRIALTFDDGPSPYTPKILDILGRERVKATFFVQGNQIAGREKDLQRMLDEGHMIGNHSFTHLDLALAGADIDGELDQTQDAIAAATGFTPCLMRPPFGRTSPRLSSALAGRSLTPIIWNVNPVDYQRPGTAKIKQRMLKQANPGGIIVDHDGGGNRSQTVAAMGPVIKALKARGYKFVTVTSLLGLGTTG